MMGQPAYCTFLGIFLLLATVTGLESGDNCTTLEGNMGTCLLVTECHPFVEALMDTSKKRVILDYMRYLVCGFQKKKSLVCCPSTTEPTTYPTTQPIPSPTAEPTPSSTTATAPSPTTKPTSSSTTETAHSSTTEPAPSLTTEPIPSSNTQPTSSPTTQTTPSSTTQPKPSSTTETTPSPTTQPTPSSTTKTTSSSTTQPMPSPATQPIPSPTTQPKPSSTTETTPSPTKRPMPSLTTEPIPSSTTETAPSRTTKPTSSSTTEPAPSSTTQPIPSSNTQPTSSPTTQTTPSSTTQPKPSSTTETTPSPTTQPTPSSTTKTNSSSTTQPMPFPATQPIPSPTTQPKPSSTTETTPSPTKRPMPSLTTEPIPSSTTATAPSRTTKPTSSSNTETAPSSTTQPTPSSTTEPTPTTPPMLDTEITIDVSHHRNLYLLPFNLCGPIGEDRIINGKVTDLNEMPWMALVAFCKPQGWEFRCGGTVINSRYVLTAAHCVKFLPPYLKPIFVRLGEHNLNSKIDCQIHEENPEDKVCAPEPQDIRIEEVISHPLYIGKPDLRYDIALLRLSTEVDFTTDSVRPICLPIGLKNQEQDLLGKMMTTAGWGLTEYDIVSDVLLKVKLPVVDSKRCTMVYNNKKAKISKKSQLCVGGLVTGENSCRGDSGGPLTFYGCVHGSLRTIQHGIVSFGTILCGIPGIPAVYTRVGFHMKWILDNMRP